MTQARLRVCAVASILIAALALQATAGASSPAGLAGIVETHAPRIPGPAPAVPHGAAAMGGWSAKNWSGYALVGSGITSVTGSWHVPQLVTPTKKRQAKKSTYSGTWVGIDGFGNSSLIQAGTEQDRVGGQAFYQAWWEILPAPETPIPSITVSPGDAITVSIHQGVPDWTITVTDVTTSQTFTTVRPYAGPMASAEWIQEAPTIGRHVATLAIDTPVVFDPGTVNGANPGLVVADSGYMYKGNLSHHISTPSTPDADTDGFSVAYGSVAPAPPSS